MALIGEADIRMAVDQFGIDGRFIHAEKFGDGHINDTYLVSVEDGNQEIKKINVKSTLVQTLLCKFRENIIRKSFNK